MIPITINGKKHKLKSIDELTTKEFIEVTRIENLDKLKFISWQLGEDYETIFMSKISDTVIQFIGEVPDVTKMDPPHELLGRVVKKHKIETIGQRFMIETTNKYKGFDLLVFIVAVAFVRDPNIERVESMMNVLYDKNYKDVLSTGNFFFHHLVNGKKSVMNTLKKIPLLIKTRLLKKVPV